MREFAAAALESIPGVAACSFGASESAPGGSPLTPVNRGPIPHEEGDIDSDYTVRLETGSGSYGQVIIELDDREQFREYEAAVHNFLGSLAMRLENIDYQCHLEERVKEQTAELNANRLFLQSILENNGDILFVIDREFSILQANKAAFELVSSNGQPGRKLLGEKCHSAFYRDDSPCLCCASVTTMQSGTPQSRTVAYPDGTGGKRWFDVSSFPICNEEGIVVNVIEAWRAIDDLKILQDELQQAVKDKELLLREIHHRVKNSLNAVMGLLRVQFSSFEDEPVQNAVNASVDRIQSTALVHEFLYKSDSLESLDFHAFVERVVHELTRTYDPGEQIEIRTDIQDIQVGINDAVPLSLIVTEVITNALKYAFPGGQPGCISIQTRVLDAETAELQIRDNGIGLPEDFDLSDIDSLGMQLVQALTSQIDGSMELSGRDDASGTCFRLRFQQRGGRT